MSINGFVIDRSDSGIDLVLDVHNYTRDTILIPDELVITPDSTANIHGTYRLEVIRNGRRSTISPTGMDIDIDHLYMMEILDGKHMKQLGPKESYSYSLSLHGFYDEIEEGHYVLKVCIDDFFFAHLTNPECLMVKFTRGEN